MWYKLKKFGHTYYIVKFNKAERIESLYDCEFSQWLCEPDNGWADWTGWQVNEWVRVPISNDDLFIYTI